MSSARQRLNGLVKWTALTRGGIGWKLLGFSLLITSAVSSGCVARRAAVSLTVNPYKGTPKDASVYVDEQFVGFLGVVAVRGIRLPEGPRRITVQRNGYFPWDTLVYSDRKPIRLEVRLRRIPD